jgi:hypothetical protein
LRKLNVYKGIAEVVLGTGESILFWKDLWNGHLLQNQYPHLFSYVVNEDITLYSVLHQKELHDIFHLPLSEEAYSKYCDLEILLQVTQLNENGDQWTYIWGSKTYSSNKAYKHLMGSAPIHPAFKWLWSSSCQQKHKVFFWLLLKNILNTRGMLQRKNMHLDSYDCELYASSNLKRNYNIYSSDVHL